MRISSYQAWIRACATALTLAGAALLTACSGGGDSTGPGPSAIGLDACDAATHETVLTAVPAAGVGGGGAGAATSLTVHYRRLAGDHAAWTLHTFLSAVETAWTAGLTPTTDSFGGVYEVALKNTTGEVGFIFHKGDAKDHGGTDQKYTLKPGKNEIWRIEGDSVTYASNPLGPAPDLMSVRVHYKRYDNNFAPWGVHIWAASGLAVAARRRHRPVAGARGLQRLQQFRRGRVRGRVRDPRAQPQGRRQPQVARVHHPRHAWQPRRRLEQQGRAQRHHPHRFRRLRTADAIKARLKFYNTGSAQVPSVIVGHLDGSGYAGAGFKELMYLVNVDKVAKSVVVDAEKTKAYTLHPVHASAQAADKRAANDSSYDAASGRFTVPPRTAVVYVVY